MTKVDIFSGFLGAGKTTLIKKLIDEAYKGEKLVLIENEFGEIGIDSGFLKDAGVTINELNSGCICCTLVGDFGKALVKVQNEFKPDRIIIEPSGVGKLSDVIRAVNDVAEEADIRVNNFIAVVDVAKAKMYMKNFGEFFNDQIEHAAAIILSRTGIVDEKKQQEAIALIREHNKDAVLVTTPWDQIGGEAILKAMEEKNDMMAELLKEEGICPVCGHHHGDDDDEHEHHHHEHGEECSCGCHHEHGHHHHHADEVFVSWGRETARVYSADEIERILTALENESEYGIVLRAKGVVDGGNGWIHFDYVPGTPDVRAGAASVTGRICVIGSKLHEDALAALFGVQ